MAAAGLSGFYGSVFKRSTTAGVLIRNGDGSVLVLRTGSGDWNLPAGVVKSGEDPRSAARRLLRDALGLELDVGRVLVLDYVQAGGTRPGGGRPGADKAGAAGDSIAFLFDGGALATTVTVFQGAGGEREARFIPLQDSRQTLDPAAFGLLVAGLDALELGTVTELVNGEPALGGPAAAPARRMMPPMAGFSTILGR